MIPISDDNRGRRTFPFINVALILINGAVFLYELSLSEPQLTAFIYRYGAIAAELTGRAQVVTDRGFPAILTIFTAMFLHGGWTHLLGNMLFLWVFGDNVEDSMGHLRYLLFYLIGGVVAVAAQVYIGPESANPMIGASGAISAVMAAYLVLFPSGLVRVLVLLGFIPLFFMVPALLVIGLWIVLQFLSGYASLGVQTVSTSGVAYFAHIGGFLAGFVLVWFFRDQRAVERQRAARQGTRAFSRRY